MTRHTSVIASPATQWIAWIDDVLDRTAPIANRWCLASERNAAEACAEKAEAKLAHNAALFHAQRLLREAMGD